ncbi:MAG: hypothetical protein M5U33_04275 [Pseudorhodoplanes sp.]|nr:hypothetical protein [Pseudorhodoplanes sp.]MBW7949599.1 hypothetical protein [Pseudorhodoplanes sp.]MCZ7642093.1 hypothetical protein [Pseudorhodoplanes sp.]
MALDLKTTDRPPSTEQQWHLALAQLQSADRAANVLRALVFMAAGAVLIVSFSLLRADAKGPALWGHGGAILLCLIAIHCVVKGFRFQSEQSAERSKLLQAGNYDGYAQYEGVIGTLRSRQSGFWDRCALWAVIAAFAVLLFVKFMVTTAAIHV